MSFDIPGIQRDDLSIELTGNRLIIAGERKSENKLSGRKYGKFQRTFTLPEGLSGDAIAAEHKDGVLSLLIPKPSAVKSTKIKIADGSGKNSFFKSLIGEKKPKDAMDLKVNGERQQAATMAS